LFHVLPLGSDLDRIDAAPSRAPMPALPWQDEAESLLAEWVRAEPVLVQISTAKRLRDTAESHARRIGAEQVTRDLLRRSAGLISPEVNA
jgi:chlorophyllide a reductase subunit Z